MKYLFVLLAVSALAQPQARIFDVKYGDVHKISGMLAVFPQEHVRWDESLRTITVRGTPEQLKAIEEVIKKYDQASAPQNLEFTVYMLMASPDPAKSGPLPPALDPIIKQLSAAFAFKGYRLAETLMLRSRDGKGSEANSIAPTTGVDGQPMIYQCRFLSARVIPDDRGKNIRVDGLRVGMRVPYRVSAEKGGHQFADIGVSTDIDVREGQKAVVGKTAMQGNESMVVVLVPKIIE